MNFDVYCYSDKGGRDRNEDSMTYLTNENNGIFVVADGLGGHKYGDLASKVVCDSLVDNWNGKFDTNLQDWLEKRIECSNKAVIAMQKEKGDILKSTVVALAVDNGRAVWANSGDSRLYYISDKALKMVTNDHSVAFKKYKAGEITREQIMTDEDQSCLLRAIGGIDRYQPEIYNSDIMLKSGDAFMLCSDGIWEYVYDREVAADYLKSKSATQWAKRLIHRVESRAKSDNDNLTIMTIVVV